MMKIKNHTLTAALLLFIICILSVYIHAGQCKTAGDTYIHRIDGDPSFLFNVRITGEIIDEYTTTDFSLFNFNLTSDWSYADNSKRLERLHNDMNNRLTIFERRKEFYYDNYLIYTNHDFETGNLIVGIKNTENSELQKIILEKNSSKNRINDFDDYDASIHDNYLIIRTFDQTLVIDITSAMIKVKIFRENSNTILRIFDTNNKDSYRDIDLKLAFTMDSAICIEDYYIMLETGVLNNQIFYVVDLLSDEVVFKYKYYEPTALPDKISIDPSKFILPDYIQIDDIVSDVLYFSDIHKTIHYKNNILYVFYHGSITYNTYTHFSSEKINDIISIPMHLLYVYSEDGLQYRGQLVESAISDDHFASQIWQIPEKPAIDRSIYNLKVQ